jgi:hypothetical protein
MSGAVLELFRHKTWATLRLIEYCQDFADEHLDATISNDLHVWGYAEAEGQMQERLTALRGSTNCLAGRR